MNEQQESVDIEHYRRPVRHEFGHFCLARHLGFSARSIAIRAALEAAVETEFPTSFSSEDERNAFLEGRLQMLYAGVLAETLGDSDWELSACARFRNTAKGDFNKIAAIQSELGGSALVASADGLRSIVESQLWKDTVGIIRDKQDAIRALTDWFLAEWSQAGTLIPFEKSVDEIESYLQAVSSVSDG